MKLKQTNQWQRGQNKYSTMFQREREYLEIKLNYHLRQHIEHHLFILMILQLALGSESLSFFVPLEKNCLSKGIHCSWESVVRQHYFFSLFFSRSFIINDTKQWNGERKMLIESKECEWEAQHRK